MASIGGQLLVLGVTSIAIEIVVLGLYIALVDRTRGLARQRRFAVLLERAAGVLLVAAGARLAVIQRG